jgi:hypothetical protein
MNHQQSMGLTRYPGKALLRRFDSSVGLADRDFSHIREWLAAPQKPHDRFNYHAAMRSPGTQRDSDQFNRCALVPMSAHLAAPLSPRSSLVRQPGFVM